MNRKNYFFYFLFFLIINFHLSYSIPRKHISFILNGNKVDTQKLKIYDVGYIKKYSIDLLIYGKLVKDIQSFNQFDLDTKKAIFKECLDFFYLQDEPTCFSFDYFTSTTSEFIIDLVSSYHDFFSILDPLYLKTTYFFQRYYLFNPVQSINYLQKLSYNILNFNKIKNSEDFNSKFKLMITSFFPAEKEIKTYQKHDTLIGAQKISHNKHIQKQVKDNLCDFVLKTLEFFYKNKNIQLINAFVFSYKDCLEENIIKKIYQKYKNDSPVLIKIAYFNKKPHLTKILDDIIALEKSEEKDTLGSLLLSEIYLFLAEHSLPTQLDKEYYLRKSINYDFNYNTILKLSLYLHVSKQSHKAASLIKILLNNIEKVDINLFNKNNLQYFYACFLLISLEEDLSEDIKRENQNRLTSLLLEQQEKNLQIHSELNKQTKEKKHQKKIALLKIAIEEYQRQQEKLEEEKQEKQIQEEVRREQYLKEKQKWAIENSLSIPSLLEPQCNFATKNKIKKKSDTQLLSLSSTFSSNSSNSNSNEKLLKNFLITIESLIHGKPLKIFNMFFESCYGKKTDQQIKISMKKFETLMKALGQEIISGKGSHKTVELNFQHIDGELKNQLLTVAKHTYLLPYQIKQIREKFLGYGLCPQKLIEILITKKLY